MTEIVINGVTYVPKTAPRETEPVVEERPEKTCFELIDELEANAPKGQTLADRARRIMYLNRCAEFRAGFPTDHVCAFPWQGCFWDYNGVYDCFLDLGSVDDETFVPRNQTEKMVMEVLGSDSWEGVWAQDYPYRPLVSEYMGKLLKTHLDLENLVELAPDVSKVFDGEEFLGWWFKDE